MSEHPIKQPISRVLVAITPIGEIAYQVGKDGVTCIEPFVKSGMHSDIPYLWIWAKDECLAELCQHNVLEVAFVAAHSPKGADTQPKATPTTENEDE